MKWSVMQIHGRSRALGKNGKKQESRHELLLLGRVEGADRR